MNEYKYEYEVRSANTKQQTASIVATRVLATLSISTAGSTHGDVRERRSKKTAALGARRTRQKLSESFTYNIAIKLPTGTTTTDRYSSQHGSMYSYMYMYRACATNTDNSTGL